MRPLIDYLPPHLGGDREIRCIQEALTALARKWQEDLTDFFLQLRPETATWGLESWERAYGIAGGAELSDERRREVLIARMRSARTATNEAICELAESFPGGEVEVTEYPGEHRFTVKLVGRMGVPEWYDAFRTAIEAFAPSHLKVDYSRRYLTVGEVNAMTVAELNATPLDYFVGGI